MKTFTAAIFQRIEIELSYSRLFIAVVKFVNRSDKSIISIGLHNNVTTIVMISHILFSFKNSNIYPMIMLSFAMLYYSNIILP